MPVNRLLKWSPLLTIALLFVCQQPAQAYIGGPPATLGMMCSWSTHAIQVKVEKVDKDKKIIVWRKLQDYKGKWPGGELVQQSVGNLQPADRDNILHWCEVGKTTVMFALESYKWSHTYIDNTWFAANTGDWVSWTVSHVEPAVLHTYCGRTEKFQVVVTAILAGKEVIVPSMSDVKDNPAQRNNKIQRLKASMKLADYNPKRDFVGWGGDDFEPLLGMPAFSQFAPITRVGPDAQGISIVDFDGDGKADVCLFCPSRLALMQNSGDSLTENALPGLLTGAHAAAWADYNGDGKPDLLLATPAGPKLYTNLGNGNFRDDTALLPRESCYNLTAAAWIDYDGDGRPDILLGNGFHGLRLYRNAGPIQQPPKPGINWSFEDESTKLGLGPNGLGSADKGDTLTIADVNGDGRPDILYGIGTGLLLLNTPDGFKEARDSGINYKPGKVGPVFGDFDNSGALSLFVPQLDGPSKLFKNDGKGRFTNVTAKSGDLGKEFGMATSAAWGDVFNDGRLHLVVGCLKGPNRLFKNKGDGTFTDATEEVGLHKHIYNTQAVAIVDLNHDGVLDLVFNNEGQDSIVLLGDSTRSGKRTPVTVAVGGPTGVTGSRVSIFGASDKLIATREIGASEGRGGQSATQAHFALDPGAYRYEVRLSTGVVRTREFSVGNAPMWFKQE